MIAATDFDDDEAHALGLGGALAFALGVLMLAGIVHILTILLVPTFAENDGWSRLARIAGEGRLEEVALQSAVDAKMPGLDPLFVQGACRLHLADGPTSIAIEERERFWSLALYDSQGTVVFSLNDRTATDGRLDMLIVNSVQAAQLKAEAASLGETVVVESPSDELVALVRFYAPVRSMASDARDALKKVPCEPVQIGEPALDPTPASAPSV